MKTAPDDIPDSVVKNYQVAYAFVGQGYLDKAVPILEQCIKDCPGFTMARNELAHALTKLGRPDDALLQRFAVLELEPQNTNYRRALINQLSEAKRYAEALKVAEVLLLQESKDAELQRLVRRLRNLARAGTIFVSYRSHNSDEARLVTELLLLNDFDVWFAEYKVLSLNYDLFESDLDSKLKGALAKCQTALVFSNEQWADSRYCQDEIRFISANYPKNRILQICVPAQHPRPLDDWPVLRDVATKTCDFQSEDAVHSLEQWLLELLGVDPLDRRFPTSPGDLGEPVQIEDTYRGGFLGTIQTGPFKRQRTPFWMHFTTPADIQCQIEGSPNLTFHHQDAAFANRLTLVMDVTPTRWKNAPVTDTLNDDRALYRRLRETARGGYGRHANAAEEGGLHLFHWNGSGHLAITFRTAPFLGYYFWKRIYVIRVQNRVDHSFGEVNLNFGLAFSGSKPDSSDFRQFCLFLPLFDEIARSLQYQGYRSPKPLIHIRMAWFMLGALFLMLSVFAIHLFFVSIQLSVWIAVGFIGGLLGLFVNHRIMVLGRLNRTGDAPADEDVLGD